MRYDMGGSFLYRQVVNDDMLVLDPESTPSSMPQGRLKQEIERYQTYFDMDLQFCRSVEGASQESNLWVVRNADATGLSDVDLQRFKNIAWNECVVKRFLPTLNGDVSTVGKSMLHIVRNLNLQWKGLEVMGLHPKVESGEKQIVMSCMEKRLLAYDLDVGRVARSLRRCPHFRDHFANAVGCHLVAKTGHTPGLSKTQYSADLDYVYKNQGLFFLESALQRNKELVLECTSSELGEDYISRLCGLKLVSRGDVQLQNPPEKQEAPVFVADGVQSNGASALVNDNLEALVDQMIALKNQLGLKEITTGLTSIDAAVKRNEAGQRANAAAMEAMLGTLKTETGNLKAEFDRNNLQLRAGGIAAPAASPAIQAMMQAMQTEMTKLERASTQNLQMFTAMMTRLGALPAAPVAAAAAPVAAAAAPVAAAAAPVAAAPVAASRHTLDNIHTLLQTLVATTATNNTALTAETGRLQTALDAHTATLTGVTRILGVTQTRVDIVAAGAAESVRLLNIIMGRLPPAGGAVAGPPPPAAAAVPPAPRAAAAPPPAAAAVPPAPPAGAPPLAAVRPPPPAAPPPSVDPRGRAAQQPASQDTNFIVPRYSSGVVTTPTSPRGTRPRAAPNVADIADNRSATAEGIADGVLGRFP